MKKKLQALAARVKVELPALFLALKDRRTSWLAKLLAFLTVAYALSPVDLIPDFIPVIGYLDDLLILPLLAGFDHQADSCRRLAGLPGEKPGDVGERET